VIERLFKMSFWIVACGMGFSALGWFLEDGSVFGRGPLGWIVRPLMIMTGIVVTTLGLTRNRMAWAISGGMMTSCVLFRMAQALERWWHDGWSPPVGSVLAVWTVIGSMAIIVWMSRTMREWIE
jgi:hypothetical protein